MPELPEVQTVLDTLENLIKDKKILDVKVIYPKIVQSDPDSFKNRLIGQSFRHFKRRGKYLLFEMDDLTLVSHLRMEGKYYLLNPDDPVDKHTHIIFSLSDGKEMRYHDVRKFGRMEIMDKKEDYRIFKDLGPEPFSDDFNVDYCQNYLKNSSLPIKQILLDQSFVAGIGNIYADEILYSIGTNPKLPGNLLKNEKVELLIQNTREILSNAIKAGGTTIRSYTSSLGVTGLFQLSLNCHTVKKCDRCSSEIKKIVVGGRGTYFCPVCQNIKIGITGSIGSGKSTFSNILREMGYFVFDCDEVNRSLLEKGNRGYLEVRKHFPEAFNGDGLDKKALSSIVFAEPEKKKELEGIMHPLIAERMIEEQKNHSPFIAEVPLLFESGWDRYFDINVLIHCDRETTIRRLKKRGLTKKEAIARLNNQMDIDKKVALSDRIIDNSKTVKALKEQAEKFAKGVLW